MSMEVASSIELTALCVTLLGALIAGSMRFGSMETRIDNLEVIGPKVDRISETVARIEGRMGESELWKK